MPKITNNFLKGKMNKDLDERIVPKGEYREAQNILITHSEGSDVGAVENILGNILAKGTLPNMPINFRAEVETIGYYIDRLNSRVFWFVTSWSGMAGDDISTMFSSSMPSDNVVMRVLMAKLDDLSNIVTLVDGRFLNFSKNHLITGVNLIDDLLFWTDNYNQPRKINVTRAISNEFYYTKEEQISVAKVAPYLAPILNDVDGGGDAVTLTNQPAITSDYLKDRFVRFSYRYKYEDGEYTTMAPFTQIVFKPLNNSNISNVLQQDHSVQDVYTKTILDVMKNDYNQVELRIPLPFDENTVALPTEDVGFGWNNDLRIIKLEILIKESDEDVVKIIKEIDVTNESGTTINKFLHGIETYSVSPAESENYFRYVYKFIYKSEEPYKILEDKQITRVYDQVPLRAKAQEISGNRLIYGNFTENYDLPRDQSGKIGINYVINDGTKGELEFINQQTGQGIFQYTKDIHKYNSLKQRRTYQVGVVLADKFGRQSSVILSTNESPGFSDTITTNNYSFDLSEQYDSSYSWSADQVAIGRALQINFRDNRIVDPSKVYNGDINSPNYNPYGWYSWKLVVKQQEQEFYNIYTSHPVDFWNNESNNSDEFLGYTWVSLYGDNINKITKDLSEISEIREDVAGSDTLLWPKVVKSADPGIDNVTDAENVSTFGDAGNDPIEVMTIGTARQQGILTDGDRDRERVHDFVMAKRNPLLAQLKNLGTQATNNRVKYSITAKVVEENNEDTQCFKIGDGATINPYIRAGQQILFRPENSATRDLANLGKPVVAFMVELNDQHYDTNIFGSKSIVVRKGNMGRFASGNFGTISGENVTYSTDMTGGDPDDFHGQMRVGQHIDFQTPHASDDGGNAISHSMSTVMTNGDEEVIRFPVLQKVEANKKANRMILHFDIPPFRDDAQISQLITSGGGAAYCTLFDPLLITDVDNVTEENGDVYQKIKMNMARTMGDPGQFGEGSTFSNGTLSNVSPKRISIQNKEHDPIAVTTGLTVLETDPFKSKLDIFYETSTSGLISDLNFLMQTSETGPSNLNFETTLLGFKENSPDDSDSFEVGTFSAESTNVTSDSIIYTNLTITRGSNGEPIQPGVFDILSGSDKLTCNTSQNFRLDDQTNASLLGTSQQPDPNANKFYGEFTAYDGEYTSGSFEFELLNVKPSITINDIDDMPFSLKNVLDGDKPASGGIFNGCSNETLNMFDMAVEIVGAIDIDETGEEIDNSEVPVIWLNGMPVFEINQLDSDENIYNIIYRTYGDNSNSLLYLKDEYGKEYGGEDVLFLKIKVTDAGGETDTNIVQFKFEDSFLQVWMMNPQANIANNIAGSITDVAGAYMDAPICDVGMDPNVVDAYGNAGNPGWVQVWVGKGEAENAPHRITHYTPPNTITSQNPDGVQSPNLLNLSLQTTVTGIQLYKLNEVYANSTGTLTYGAATDGMITIDFKYFKKHVENDDQGNPIENPGNWPSKLWQYFQIDANGVVGNIEDCPVVPQD